MRKRYYAALPFLFAFGPCGYDMEAAGITVSDGGLEVPYQQADGGNAFFDVPQDLTKRPLPPFPPMEKICMLFIGDWSERTVFPKGVGTWVEDAMDPRLFGPIAGGGDFKDNESASLRYTYKHPSIPEETAAISLRFEHIYMTDTKNHDVREGVPWPNPYFLSDVKVQGLGGEIPPCLDWVFRNRPETHWVPCDWCSTIHDYTPCTQNDPRDCFGGSQ